MPLIEDQPIEKKLEVGASFFNLQRLSKRQWINNLLRHDNEWLITCTLHLIGEDRMNKVDLDIIENHALSDNAIISETALLCLNNLYMSANNEDFDIDSERLRELARDGFSTDIPSVQQASKKLLDTISREQQS